MLSLFGLLRRGLLHWRRAQRCPHDAVISQGFASDDGPPHKGQREQSGEAAAQDRQRLAEEDAVSEALSGADPANGAAAVSPPAAQSAAASDTRADDATTALNPEVSADVSLVEAELGKLGFEAGDDDEGLEALQADGLTSLSGVSSLPVPIMSLVRC